MRGLALSTVEAHPSRWGFKGVDGGVDLLPRARVRLKACTAWSPWARDRVGAGQHSHVLPAPRAPRGGPLGEYEAWGGILWRGGVVTLSEAEAEGFVGFAVE